MKSLNSNLWNLFAQEVSGREVAVTPSISDEKMEAFDPTVHFCFLIPGCDALFCGGWFINPKPYPTCKPWMA